MTAKATGISVYAGPHEAAVIGNLMCQMITGKELVDLESAINVELASFSIKYTN